MAVAERGGCQADTVALGSEFRVRFHSLNPTDMLGIVWAVTPQSELVMQCRIKHNIAMKIRQSSRHCLDACTQHKQTYLGIATSSHWLAAIPHGRSHVLCEYAKTTRRAKFTTASTRQR